MPDPQRRLTVAPDTSTGRPASKTAIRPTLRLSSPAWLAAPHCTSSMADGSSDGLRSRRRRTTWAARSSGRTKASCPPIRPIGVRQPSTMKTSVMPRWRVVICCPPTPASASLRRRYLPPCFAWGTCPGPLPPPPLRSGGGVPFPLRCAQRDQATVRGMPEQLFFTESEDANRLLASDGLALMIGMLLDQQFPMERAFYGPYLLAERLGEDLDAARLASMDPDELETIFKGPPAIHRFPGSMARRTQEMCRVIADEYDNRAENVWETAGDAGELLKRLKALPGWGEAKSRIFVGVLGKRLGVAPSGWEEKAADWPSIADVARYDDVLVLREQKREMKAKQSG